MPKHTSTMRNGRRGTGNGRAAFAAVLCLSALFGFVPVATAAQGWQQPDRLSEVAHNATSPEVVVSAHGTAMAIWGAQAEGGNVVQVTERPASSGVWQAPVTLSTPGQDAQSGQVAIAPDGEAIAVWEQLDGNFDGGHFVVWSSVRAPGGSWGVPIALSGPSEAGEPQIAIDAAGEAVAVWENSGESNGENTIVLQAAVRPGPGAAWEAPVGISDTSQEAVDPQIALNEEGEALAAWHLSAGSTQAIQVAVRHPKSGWEAPIALSGAGYAGDPRIALNNKGAAAVTWASSEESGNDLIEASSRATANSEWVPATLAEGELNPERFESPQPEIGIDAAGEAAAAWPLLSGNKDLVQAATMKSDGSWQSPVTLAEPEFEGSDPQLAMNPQGEAVAIWTARVGSDISAQGSSLSEPTGTWSPAQTLSAPGVFVFEPAIAIDPKGGAFSIWSSTQNNENVIQAATYIPPGSSEVTITTSESRALLGETVTLKAKIEPTPEDPHPGTVRFRITNDLEVDPDECEGAVNATTGEASCEISETAAAEFEWVAEYSGSEDGTFPAATSAPLKMEWAFPSPCTSGYYSTTGLEPCSEAGPGNYVAGSDATGETSCSEGTYQPDSHSERCNPAGLGHYVEGKGATSQTACEAGTFDAESGSTLATDCIAASLGHFVANEGEGSEEECAIGSYASIAHSEVCVPAEPGHYVAQPGAAFQQECVAGTYSDEPGESECSTTPEGHYSAAGATTPISCDPGTNDPHTNSTTSAACETDPAGSYSGSGAASATLCDAGTSNPNTGSTTSAACELDVAGSWSAPGAATATLCAAGTYSAVVGATSSAACQEAGPGYSDPTAGLTEEIPCQPGTYAPLSGSEHCTPAGLGHYVSEQAQSTEQECPAGMYASVTESIVCKPAETGHYVSQTGSATQQECVAGTYSDEPGESECSTTPEGHYSAAGAISATPCDLGTNDPHTNSTTSAACETDPAGSYSGSGAASATLCDAGTYDTHTGSTTSAACEADDPGSWSTSGAASATLCNAGTYSALAGATSASACQEAGPGYSDPTAGLTEEIPCQPGAYAPLSGSEHCTPAGLGHYVSEQAQSAEQECVAGTFASATGSIVCKPAETGHYVSQTGSASQQECVAGTYSERTEATTCSTTPEGDYSGSGAVAPTPCGPGTTNPTTGATSSAACEADGPGSYSGSGATQASLCEPGTFQPNTGSSDCEEAEAGHYVNAHGASVQTECPAGTYSSVKRSTICLTTPKNTYSGAGAIEPLSCAKGTESGPGSSSCTSVPTAAKEEPKTEVKTETKIETPAKTTTTPLVQQPAKGHEATPIITKLKLNHSCLAPATLVLDSRAAQGLNLSFRLNETASIEYKIAPGKGATKSAKCPRGKGHSKAKPEPVWTGPHIASKAKKKHKVAPTKVPLTLTAGSHQVLLAAALAAAHINAKHLRPGTYVLTVLAVNAEGKRSIATTVKFWVVNPPKHVHTATGK